MSRRRGLTPEDEALWRRTTRDVRPMDDKPAPSLSPPAVVGPRLTPDTRATRFGASPQAMQVARNSSRAPDSFNLIGAGDPRTDKRAAREKLPIDARLDLHGLTQAAAEVRLAAFLEQALRDNCACVLVITGKGGVGPERRGVLHRRFPEWINGAPLRGRIARVAPAHRRHGGDGAWYVFLKSR